MRNLRAILFFTVLVALAVGGSALAAGSQKAGLSSTPDGIAFLHDSATTHQVKLVAPFVRVLGSAGVDTSISVSNTLPAGAPGVFAGPPAGLPFDTAGKVRVFLVARDGSVTVYDSSIGPLVGNGLTAAGILGPGATWTVLLSEILAAVGLPQDFAGWLCVVADVDGAMGTATITSFTTGPITNFQMFPAAGLPVFIP